MKDSYFLSQPHQPFFLLAIIDAVVSMVLFMLGYKGVVHPIVDVSFFHFYSLAFLVFLSAFSGFLFTTFPRFNQTQPIQKRYYSEVFYALALASVLFFGGVFSTKLLLQASLFMTLTAQGFVFYKLYTIYKSSTFADRSDSFWILVGMGFGVLANVLAIFSQQSTVVFSLSVGVGVFLYLVFTAFAVAQRMIPFFSHSFAPKNKHFVPVVFGLLVLEMFDFVFEAAVLRIGVELVLAFVLAKEIMRLGLRPFESPAILWVLHLAFFWLPFGFFLSAFAQMYALFSGTSVYFLGIHVLLLGFLLTVLVGFGTRVILGHSAQVPHADKLSVFLFWLTQAVVLARMAVSLDVMFGFGLGWLFDIAATLWIAVFTIWGGRFAKTLVFGKK